MNTSMVAIDALWLAEGYCIVERARINLESFQANEPGAFPIHSIQAGRAYLIITY